MRTLYFRPVVSSFSSFLWPPYGIGQVIIFLSSGFFFHLSIFLFFLAYSQPSQIGCLPYFHTWCGQCEFRMQVFNVLHATRRKKSSTNIHLGNIAQLCRAISSQLKHVPTIAKKVLNSNDSTTCPNTMWYGPRPTFVPSDILIHPAVWPQ